MVFLFPRALCALVVAFVILDCCPLSGRAADPKIEWRTDYSAARKESQDTGLPILVQIGTEDCFYCKKMEATTLRDTGVVALAAEFIPLKIDGNKEVNLTKSLKVQLYPTTVLAGADGTIHAFVQGYVDADSFKGQLKRVHELVAADTKIAKEISEVSASIKAGQYGRAIPQLQRLALVTKGKTTESKVKELLQSTEAIGRNRMAEAKRLFDDGRREESVQTLQETATAFAGTDWATRADAQLAALGIDRLDRIAIGLRATALLTAARDLAKAGAYAEAIEIATLLNSSAEAKAAAALVAEIHADPNKLAAAARQSNESAAAIQLAMADAYAEKGQNDAAAKCLDLAIRLVPNTRKSEQAEARLAKLRGPVPAIPAVLQK